jgi:hypothetical protein
MTDDVVLETLKGIQAELGHIRAEFAPMRAQLDGRPLINRSITVLHQDVRSLRAAFNDFARTNVTAGEIEVLHADVNRVQAENGELAAKVATLERLVQGIARLKGEGLPREHAGGNRARPRGGHQPSRLNLRTGFAVPRCSRTSRSVLASAAAAASRRR